MRSPLARATSALTLAAFCTALAPAASAQAPDPAKIEEAKKHMQAGAAFYNDPAGHKCEEAIREFGKAFELSGSLNALKGQAVCNLELERDAEAIDQYTKYLAGKGSAIDPEDKKQVEADLNALKAAVAWVTLSTDNPAVRVNDVRTPSKGYPISNRYDLPNTGRRIGVHPGAHVFTASMEGKLDAVWKVEISNGMKYDHFFEMKDIPVAPPPEEKPQLVAKRPVPASVFVMGGLTIALGGAMTGLMLRASGKASDYKEKNGHLPAVELTTLQGDVKSANLVADIFLGATVASAVTTVVLLIARPTKMVPVTAPKTGSLTFTPTVGQSGGGALLVGSF